MNNWKNIVVSSSFFLLFFFCFLLLFCFVGFYCFIRTMPNVGKNEMGRFVTSVNKPCCSTSSVDVSIGIFWTIKLYNPVHCRKIWKENNKHLLIPLTNQQIKYSQNKQRTIHFANNCSKSTSLTLTRFLLGGYKTVRNN